MSTPSIPFPRPSQASARLATIARRLVRGREDDPWWSRPGLIAVSVIAAVLVVWALTISGYANGYYAAAALAASHS
jgi:hypothetical protein